MGNKVTINVNNQLQPINYQIDMNFWNLSGGLSLRKTLIIPIEQSGRLKIP